MSSPFYLRATGDEPPRLELGADDARFAPGTNDQCIGVPSGCTLVVGKPGRSDVGVCSRLMSRTHAELGNHGGVWTVRDLGSLHGTYLNEERVREEPRVLQPADKVCFADACFIVSRDPQVDASVLSDPLWTITPRRDGPGSPTWYTYDLRDPSGKVCKTLDDIPRIDAGDDSVPPYWGEYEVPSSDSYIRVFRQGSVVVWFAYGWRVAFEAAAYERALGGSTSTLGTLGDTVDDNWLLLCENVTRHYVVAKPVDLDSGFADLEADLCLTKERLAALVGITRPDGRPIRYESSDGLLWVARAGAGYAMYAPSFLLPCWVLVDEWLAEAFDGWPVLTNAPGSERGVRESPPPNDLERVLRAAPAKGSSERPQVTALLAVDLPCPLIVVRSPTFVERLEGGTSLVEEGHTLLRWLENTRFLKDSPSLPCHVCDTPECSDRHPMRMVRLGDHVMLWATDDVAPSGKTVLFLASAWVELRARVDAPAAADLPRCSRGEFLSAWWGAMGVDSAGKRELLDSVLIGETLDRDTLRAAARSLEAWAEAAPTAEIDGDLKPIEELGLTLETAWLDGAGSPEWCVFARGGEAIVPVLAGMAWWPLEAAWTSS